MYVEQNRCIYANTRIVHSKSNVFTGFRCDASVPVVTGSSPNRVFCSRSGIIKLGQVAQYSMSFPFSFEKSQKNYLHVFIINLLCLNTFFYVRRIVFDFDSMSYCMIYTIQ